VSLEAELRRVAHDLADAHPSPLRHPVAAAEQRLSDLALRDEELRAALFRLVDVAPACRTPEEVGHHFGSLLGEVSSPARPVALARRSVRHRAARVAAGTLARRGVNRTGRRFIVAQSTSEAGAALGRLWEDGVAATVDLLGEATVTDAEADRYAAACARALEDLSEAAPRWPARPVLERDSTGGLPRVNLSIKLSALTARLHPEAPAIGAADAAPRLRALLRLARDRNAHLHVDMESLDDRETTLDLLLELLSEPEFRDGPSAGTVLQAYLVDASGQLDRLLDWAAASDRTTPLTIRLVKGAYWDHELVQARQAGWPSPVFEVKADCDRTFEALTRRLLDARPAVRVAIASHNLRSVAHAIAYDRLGGGSGTELELQVLRGLGDDLQEALRRNGMRVRSYCPVGNLVAGMAYLVRRLLENSSNESFLAQRARGADLDKLLVAP
jgi:RHH-type proline utilization regulon transcriptional repressor/proline dehydrogenase/delta 1-pyrroline-5-carboxylate dehydrogenase